MDVLQTLLGRLGGRRREVARTAHELARDLARGESPSRIDQVEGILRAANWTEADLEREVARARQRIAWRGEVDEGDAAERRLADVLKRREKLAVELRDAERRIGELDLALEIEEARLHDAMRTAQSARQGLIRTAGPEARERSDSLQRAIADLKRERFELEEHRHGDRDAAGWRRSAELGGEGAARHAALADRAEAQHAHYLERRPQIEAALADLEKEAADADRALLEP